MTKTINAPGYEINELDMSQYDRSIDNSFDNAPVCLVLGYGDLGESSIPRWINTTNTFLGYFGNPETEEEKYFYNATTEILKRNGVCIAAKMPYSNQQEQNYIKCKFKIDKYDISDGDIAKLDSSIKNAMRIEKENNISSITNLEYQNYLSRTTPINKDEMIVVDISKSILDSVDFNCVSVKINNVYKPTNECLGIMPVVFTAANALFYQGILSTNISPVSRLFDIRSKTINNNNVSYAESLILSSLSIPLSTDNVYDNAVANIAESQYPTISWKDDERLQRDNLKNIGIAVFKAYADKSNDGNIAFDLVESFVGSPIRSNEVGSLRFIDDIVNEQSKYINVFSNIQLSTYQDTDITYANANDIVNNYNCKPPMFGFYRIECNKTIPESTAIEQNAKDILNKLENPNMLPIDIVVDAGMSTIAFNRYNNTYDVSNLPSMDNIDNLSDRIGKWYKYLQIYDDFCKNKRKDCMFIADMPRSFSLNGQSKIVNLMSNATVRSNLISKLRQLKKLNTSYGAGYATWLLTTDAYSGQRMWMPPSIKMAGIYTYCDTYFHPWSAPAGLTRGIINDAVDVSFNPMKQDCEQLYMNGWNYVISYPINGIVVEGQKTFQSEATALDRVNIRRLMLYIERRIAYVAKYFQYENNTPYQRQMFVDRVNAILSEVRSGNGISDFAVKCDETNNTPDVIDRNELRLSLAVKPVKAIEFIVLKFTLTNQTADVQETIANM